MTSNLDKIDDVALALLLLISFREKTGEFAATHAWEGYDWEYEAAT